MAEYRLAVQIGVEPDLNPVAGTHEHGTTQIRTAGPWDLVNHKKTSLGCERS